MQGQAAWQLQRRRRELLEALDASIRHLLSLEEPLNSWAAHSAQAEAAMALAAGKHHARKIHSLPVDESLRLQVSWQHNPA